jgi:integral membrane protein
VDDPDPRSTVPSFLSSPVGRFRAVAIAEAVSWAGLLAGMAMKYGPPDNEVGVQIFGPIHGALFLIYVVVAFITWPIVRWSTPVGVVAILAGLPPFGTVVFERWATRTGRLVPVDDGSGAGPVPGGADEKARDEAPSSRGAA